VLSSQLVVGVQFFFPPVMGFDENAPVPPFHANEVVSLPLVTGSRSTKNNYRLQTTTIKQITKYVKQ
jgi:hypothetical protein